MKDKSIFVCSSEDKVAFKCASRTGAYNVKIRTLLFCFNFVVHFRVATMAFANRMLSSFPSCWFNVMWWLVSMLIFCFLFVLSALESTMNLILSWVMLTTFMSGSDWKRLQSISAIKEVFTLDSAEEVDEVFMARCCPVSTDRVISERTVVIMTGGRVFRRVSTIVNMESQLKEV